MTKLAILLLGSNLGERTEFLDQAFRFLTGEIGQLDRKSSVFESSPWGVTDQPDFLNQVVGIHTSFAPQVLLEKCLAFEKSTGRKRDLHWGPRTIDIDVLYYADQIIDQEGLCIPHPGIPHRRFTLAPLCDAYPDLIHPRTGSTQRAMMEACTDPGEVRPANVHA